MPKSFPGLDWIQHQINAKERRREVCESRRFFGEKKWEKTPFVLEQMQLLIYF